MLGRQPIGIQEGDLVTVLGRKMRAFNKSYQQGRRSEVEEKDAQETDATELSDQWDVGMKERMS